MRYRATYNGRYLFHVSGSSPEDALREAQALARWGVGSKAAEGLIVTPEN